MNPLDRREPIPVRLVAHTVSRVLEIEFSDQRTFSLSFEFLRVHSPSAEVRGHGPGQEVLQVGKRDVQITAIEPVGHYAMRPLFSDGHDSGLFTWAYLYQLGMQHDTLWRDYLSRLERAGASREARSPVAQQAPSTPTEAS